jgi:hypothetical protein
MSLRMEIVSDFSPPPLMVNFPLSMLLSIGIRGQKFYKRK